MISINTDPSEASGGSLAYELRVSDTSFSFIFVFLDAAGDLTSLLSVGTRTQSTMTARS